MSAFGGIADIGRTSPDVRLRPKKCVALVSCVLYAVCYSAGLFDLAVLSHAVSVIGHLRRYPIPGIPLTVSLDVTVMERLFARG
jgi:hypothetical protein